jgi:hypothetical protein
MHIAGAAQEGLELSRFITLYQSRCHFQTTILENIQNYEKLKGGTSVQTPRTTYSKNTDAQCNLYKQFQPEGIVDIVSVLHFHLFWRFY